jgi:hypothetical protein
MVLALLGGCTGTTRPKMMNLSELTDFATRYAAAWSAGAYGA